jgi:indoleamine 2,3-dioxygenase
MLATLKRMPDGCSPEVYYHSVRPYLFGFTDVVYEQVWKGKKVTLRGETGAQSSIVPSLVAAFGIRHEASVLTKHTRTMRHYMPPAHRAFIAQVRRGPSLRGYVRRRGASRPALKSSYNACLWALHDFRAQHYEWARVYIHERVSNPLGSGGTIFMPWLKLLLDETKAHAL